LLRGFSGFDTLLLRSGTLALCRDSQFSVIAVLGPRQQS
jgi:hypothetical protein